MAEAEAEAEAEALAFNISVPSDGLQGRSRLEKLMHKWLDVSDEAGQRLKYVLRGPGGVGKSTLALKFDAGKVGAAGGGLSGSELEPAQSFVHRVRAQAQHGRRDGA